MKKMLQGLSLVVMLIGLVIQTSFAQSTPQRVTIRDLNTYASLTAQSDIPNQSLKDSLVSFTAVIVAYPKNSGLASYTQSTDGISRIHVFVTDTTAMSDRKEGMSMQIVETDVSMIENFNRGDVVDITGRLTFYANTAQFDLESITDISTNAGVDPARFKPLLNPIKVSVSDLNKYNSDGTMELNLANYSKYVGSYVEIDNATITNVSTGDRPNWALKQGDNLIYIYDTSLRYRNDRSTYRTGYNYRHTEDGNFVPPPAGAVVNVKGFITLNNDDPDALNATGMDSFTINPWDDGIVWLNGAKNVDGQNGFSWPNDVTVVGYPPSFANFTISDRTPKSTDQVTVSADITADGSATVQKVELIYNDGTKDSTVAMTNTGGDTYTYQFPAFANFTSVSFTIKATDDGGLVGTYPQGAAESFIVLDQQVNSISVIQKTPDGKPGSSPLDGVGLLPMNVKALVMADSADGFVIIQDSSVAWSGVYLDAATPNVKALKRGDQITLTKGEVKEDYGITYVTNATFTVDSHNNDITKYIPSILTQDITSGTDRGEAYEGMIVKFEDLKVVTNQADGSSDYGEWEIGSRQGGDAAADTLTPGQGLRVDEGVPSFGSGPQNISGDMNENIKIDAQVTSLTGAVYYSYGNPKMILRSVSDIVGTDWTYPTRTFSLTSPADNATVEVTGSTTVQWGSSMEYDGNKVHYIWALAGTSDTTFTNPVAEVASDNNGEANSLTLDFKTVDDILANAGLSVGDSKDLIWSVFVTDGVDTVQASTYSGTDFTPTYNTLTLTRGVDTGIEDNNGGLPHNVELNQNYPNPFNPTTTIKYALPSRSNVRLTVYNILGRRVAVLVNKVQSAGNYMINFDASKLSSGMYFYRLEAGSKTLTQKMILIK